MRTAFFSFLAILFVSVLLYIVPLVIARNDIKSKDLEIRTKYWEMDLGIDALNDLLDQDFVASDTYAPFGFNGIHPHDTREERFDKLLLQFEHTGSQPINIIFSGPSWPTKQWKVAFDGCAINKCVGLAESQSYVLTSDEEFKKYLTNVGSEDRSKIFDLGTDTIRGTEYRVSITVYNDYAGHVTTTKLNVFRDTVSKLESLLVNLNSGAPLTFRTIVRRNTILVGGL